MKSLFFAIGVAIVSIVAAIAASSAAWLFWDALKATDREAFRVIIGAFAGAFFAYVFVRFGDALKKVYDRKETNHTALVKLQHYFNDCLNTTSDNVFVVNDCVGVLSEARLASADVLPIYANSFHQYPINRDLVADLTNVNFLNEVYSLNVTLHKMNHDLASIDRFYSRLHDALLARNIDHATYIANARQYRDKCTELKAFLLQLKVDLVRLFAATNILLKDKPFLVRVIQTLVRRTYPKNFDALLQVEQTKVIAEMESSAKASAQKIREAQGK